jgi:hypothetical protein
MVGAVAGRAMNALFGFLGAAASHLRLMGVAAALVAAAVAWSVERSRFRALTIQLSAAVPWSVGAAGLVLLCIAEWRYAAHPAPLDLVEAHYAMVSWQAHLGMGVYDHDPGRRVVAMMYGPLSYIWYAWVQALFGPSMIVLKLAAAACTMVGILAAAGAVVRLAGRRAGGAAASLMIAAIGSGGVFFLLVRADPLLMLGIGFALLLSSVRGQWEGWAMLGAFVLSGGMALLKPNIALALWSLLLLLDRRSTAGGGGAIVALARAGTAAAAGSCIAVMVRVAESREMITVLLGARKELAVLPDLLSENLLIAGIPLAVCTVLETATRSADDQPQWPALVALLAGLTGIWMGSADGAGDNHALLILVMCIAWGASLWWRTAPRFHGVIRMAALGLAISLVPPLLARTPSMLWQTRGDRPGSALWITQGQSMVRSFGGTVAIAVADNSHDAYEAMLASPYLVYAGAEQRLEPMAVMLWRKLGNPAAAFRPLLESPEIDAWILPTNAAPFMLDNWFGGEGPLFGLPERRVFTSTFRPWCRGTRWTLWTRPGTAANRPAASCASGVRIPPA